MAEQGYDVIVVGARCAGAPTAMLLARLGYKVLVVDRSIFPSDTISTHILHPPGVAALRRWGLLDPLIATGCPPIDTYAFDFGPIVLAGAPGTPDEPVAYCPRRTVLDALLLDAAREAGVEVREGFIVDDVIVSEGRVIGIRGHGHDGKVVHDRAELVIGADGRHSRIARAVDATTYRQKTPILCTYYAYWSGLPTGGRFETYLRDRRGFAAVATHDDQTLVIGGWPFTEYEVQKPELERNYLALFDMVPSFAARIRRARRESRVMGAAVESYFRKPYGPGWALVGDAGYNKDPITAQGLSDAFRDAELLVAAVHEASSGARRFEDAMHTYWSTRDEHVIPMFELTCKLATLEPPPPDLQHLFAAIAGDQDAMDAFVRVNAGVTSPDEFFAPANVTRLFAAAAARTASATAPPRPSLPR